MYRWLAGLAFAGTGCAGLLGIDDLAGESDSQVEVRVLVDRTPAPMVDVVGHFIDGSVSDHQLTDSSGVALVAIPSGGAVSALLETAPGEYELRTWFDLDDGDAVSVNAVVAAPALEAALTLSDQNSGGLLVWRVAFRDDVDAGIGDLGEVMAASFDRNQLGDGQTISVIARLRSGGAAERTSAIIDAPVDPTGTTELTFPRWTGERGGPDGLAVSAPTGANGALVTGEIRDGQFFVGEEDELEPGAPYSETVLVDREFAELIGVALLDGAGARIQLDHLASDAADYELEVEPLAELEAAAIERAPRVELSWSLAAGDTDAVLARVQLFDVTAPAKKLTWTAEAHPQRGFAVLPSFPEGLPADPGAFTGFDAGSLRGFASSAHDGYRALREGEVQLAGHMASEAPIIGVPGRVREQSLDLPPP
jgi:hypothetical protein